MHTPRARRRAHVRPGQLGEAVPFIIGEIPDFVTFPGLQHHDLDTLLSQFVCERAAAGTGPDDDDDRVVVEIIFRSHGIPPELLSFDPRL